MGVLKMDGEEHYVRGGKPGYYPALSRSDDAAFPHPVPLNLWDPFGFTKKMTPERKEKALLAEVNNGRLAQIGRHLRLVDLFVLGLTIRRGDPTFHRIICGFERALVSFVKSVVCCA